MNLHKILKISAKESFLQLREASPYFCKKLNLKIHITRVFWNHINFSKFRTLKEVSSRLAIFPLILKVIKEGGVKKETTKYIKVVYNEKGIDFVIILEKTPKKVILLSCFIDNKKHSVSRTNANSSV